MSQSNSLSPTFDQQLSLREKCFLAPYTENSKSIAVRISGINYIFRIVGHSNNGVGLFRPVDLTCARFLKESDPEQAEEYFSIFPRIEVTLITETNLGWCGYINTSHTVENKELHGKIVIVRNVMSAKRFDTVISRLDLLGGIWYDSLSDGNSFKSERMRQCFSVQDVVQSKLNLTKIEDIGPDDIKVFSLALDCRRTFILVNKQKKLDSGFFDNLYNTNDFIVDGSNIELEWMSSNPDWSFLVGDKKHLNVMSLGIYNEGENTKFNINKIITIDEIMQRG